MKILKLFVWFLILTSLFGPLQAFELKEVELLELSSTKKSIIIDQGLLENFLEGTKAKFFIQSGDYTHPKVFLIAEGRLVKSLPKKSFWYMTKFYHPEVLVKGNKYLILTSDEALAGRSTTLKRQHVVVSPEQYSDADDYLDQNQNVVPDRLIEERDEFNESLELYETDAVNEADVEVRSFEHFKKQGGTRVLDAYDDLIQEKFFLGQRGFDLGDIKKASDKKIFDSLAEGLVIKTNTQKYPLLNGLYKDQKKISGSRDINEQISISSVYETAKENQRRKETVAPEAEAKIAREGDYWSANMDDRSLRHYFIRSGLEKENRRRELVLNELEGNELTLHYAGAMTSHSSADFPNYRGMGYMLQIGYDLHLSRTSKNLKQWSLYFLMERGVTDYDVGSANARGQEGYFGLYLNYYFYNNPLTLNSFIWLAGIGIKGGSVDMESIDLSRDYTYQSLTLPSFQIMTKYRFRTGDLAEDTVNIGASLNGGMMLDYKRLSVIETLSDNIDSKINISDLKYFAGMSFYF